MERNQHKGGFTSLVLSMAACTGSLEPSAVQEAMLQIKTRDVEAWTRSQIGATLLSKRKKAFGHRRKYKVRKIKPESTGIPLEKAVGF